MMGIATRHEIVQDNKAMEFENCLEELAPDLIYWHAFLQDNKSTEFDNWIEDLEPDLNYYIEGIALLIICTFGIIGTFIQLTPSYMKIVNKIGIVNYLQFLAK